MSRDQILVLLVLVATIAMFLRGRWRHDMVAGAALLACVATGLVPAGEAFVGFGHPAVITVACVLVLSRALQTSGAVDVLTRRLLPARAGATASIAALTGLAALLSAFMNNVGALALLIPVALQVAQRLDLAPGKVLMPLAFGSILGGTTTLIGTPPNLIVSGFRESSTGSSGFAMFDFAPVGVPLAVAGLGFMALIGWRMVPTRRRSGAQGFEAGAYVTEARVPEGSPTVGKRMRDLEDVLDEAGAQILGLVRNEVYVGAPRSSRDVRAGDILIIEAEADALAGVLATLGLRLEEDRKPTTSANPTAPDAPATDTADAVAPPADAVTPAATKAPRAPADEWALVEMAVLPASEVVGRSASDLALRTRYGINLLAVSRQGTRSIRRLRSMPLLPGDVLLLQGPPDVLGGFASDAGCVPLATRDLRLPDRRRAITATLVMLAAVMVTALGLVPAAVAFAGAVLASLALGTVPARSAYDAVDWSVIVLLACLLPVSEALHRTGMADVIARFLLDHVARGDAAIALATVLVTTAVLTDVMNNAATAAVLAPIAVGTANRLGVAVDPFLMAVSVGASCSFLTPIGHQNNTLILGPGGFHFGDYWRVGLLLEVVVLVVAYGALRVAWPL